MNYDIHSFWIPRLQQHQVPSDHLIDGWHAVNEGLSTFIEAPLTLNEELSDSNDPLKSKIILVSAPGAVGKSTLAKQIAFKTGGIYVDLAESDPVGGNTISGGIVKSKIFQQWQDGSVALLIDGLDEARLRVTQEAIIAFIKDVVDISKDSKAPIVLFGRTGAVQETWIILADLDIDVCVLEIGFFNQADSVEFVATRLRSEGRKQSNESADQEAVSLLLENLRMQTDGEGDRFAGYAPVLIAITARILKEDNPAALVAKIRKREETVTLQAVAQSILEREHRKIGRLDFIDKSLLTVLYTPEEQLDRLASIILKIPTPVLPPMHPNDAQTYSRALETWVSEHPFLVGGTSPSSAVFDAMISAHALKSTGGEGAAALSRELKRGSAANPFLSEFYFDDGNNTSDQRHLPPGHIGVVYNSFRARLSIGDSAHLSVEGKEEFSEENALLAEVEITHYRRDTDLPRIILFDSDQASPVCLGSYIVNVTIDVPFAQVDIGIGSEVLFISPVSIQCKELRLDATGVIIEEAPGEHDSMVYLEASTYFGPKVSSVPILRGGALLRVSWPDSNVYPWNTFSTEPTPIPDPRVEEALRRLRKFVIVFRSHGRGQLAKYKGKIEHERMTKGTGQAILDLLLSESILELKAPMYCLNPDRLAAITGLTYNDCVTSNYGQLAIDFVSRAL